MDSWSLPTRIIYGSGCFPRIEGVIACHEPGLVLVVAGGKSMQKTGYLEQLLSYCGCETKVYRVRKEPSVEVIEDGLAKSREADLVVGLGGGSVLDAGKAIAVLRDNPGGLEDYLHGGRIIERPGIPFIAVPSTSGTGSEVTMVSVVSDPYRGFKKSFRSELMYPVDAVVDPELTLSCPPEVTASAGLDALSHALESFTSSRSTPVTDALAFESMRLIHDNLMPAFTDGMQLSARAGMSRASLLAGMAISNSGLGLVHGLAHSIGLKYAVPHGEICGFLLPHSVRYNSIGDTKYDLAAQAFGLGSSRELVDYLLDLNERLGLGSSLRNYSIPEEDFPWIVENSFSGSMRANPREMGSDELLDLLASMM